jgi:hypothetical protein
LYLYPSIKIKFSKNILFLFIFKKKYLKKKYTRALNALPWDRPLFPPCLFFILCGQGNWILKMNDRGIWNWPKTRGHVTLKMGMILEFVFCKHCLVRFGKMNERFFYLTLDYSV